MALARSVQMKHRMATGCRPRRRVLVNTRAAAAAAAVGRNPDEPHLQLATARLPPSANPELFADALYQWAATMTQSGANFPFALPLKADRLPTGFQISLLKRSSSGGFGSAGDIVATLEDAASVGPVLMVRFFEGPCAMEGRSTPPPADETERLEVVLGGLVDVGTIMGTMPTAIRNAAARAAQ